MNAFKLNHQSDSSGLQEEENRCPAPVRRWGVWRWRLTSSSWVSQSKRTFPAWSAKTIALVTKAQQTLYLTHSSETNSWGSCWCSIKKNV